jgi:heptose I phosphotransferase
MRLELTPALRAALPEDAFNACMHWPGAVFSEDRGRQTLQVQIGDATYFLKRHDGVGWREIAKNLLQLRLPILGARTEVRAIARLHALGVPTMTTAGWGERGLNPARRQSFILTEALQDTVSLATFCADWGQRPHWTRPQLLLKRQLLRQLAGIARTLHDNGVNHRDFYLCHFLLRKGSPGLTQPGAPLHLHVIDLHRVQRRRRTPFRWRVKDVASLYFSALDAGLTRTDCLRFMQLYAGQPLRLTLGNRFWKAVSRRAESLYRKAHGRAPRLPL